MQIAGLRVAWNPAGTAQVLASSTFVVTTPGTRIQTVALTDAAGKTTDVIVSGGALVGDAARTYRMVTLNFLETGGDGYPFPKFRTENPTRYNLIDLTGGAAAGFGVTGFEQDAFADHMLASYPLSGSGYQLADTPVSGDLRLQNTVVRTATRFTPFATASAVTMLEDTASTGSISLSDPDTAVTALTATVSVADPTLVSATVTGTGASRVLNISPLTNRNGATSISVTISDGEESYTVVVAATVTPVNDAPQAANATISATVGTAKTGTLPGTDVDGGTLTYSKVSDPTKGTLSIVAATGAYTYTANAGTSGTDSFTYKVNDGSLESNIATVSISILPADGSGSSGTSGSSDDDSSRCGIGSGLAVMLLSMMLGMSAVLRRRK